MTRALAEGTAYQFAWESYPTATAPDWTSPALASPTTGTTVIGATGSESADATATLTIVYGIDWVGNPDVVVNKEFGFVSTALPKPTIQDLLDAAVTEGDIQGYTIDAGGGYLTSITRGTKVILGGSALYWGQYENGIYSDFSKGTVETQPLEDSSNYQFAWESYPTAVTPDWSSVGSPTKGSGTAGGSSSESGGSTNTPVSIDGTLYENLFHNIAAAYTGTSDPWEALELSAAGLASTVDKAALAEASLAAYATPDFTNLQRSIIALTAVGIDATAVPTSQGTINLIDKLAKSSVSYSTLYGELFALLAYECGPYVVPSDALYTTDYLLTDILSQQNSDGSFSLSGGSSDSDTTAMAIAALAPYRQSRANVNEALTKALDALHSFQRPDGGFAAATWGGVIEANTNPNSTAMAVVALCAAGLDPSNAWATGTGGTPLSALLSFTNASQTGFLYSGSENPLATEQGFRALVAYRGFVNTGAAYNIYTQARLGQATLPRTSSTDTGQTPGGLANTKDGTGILPVATTLIAACALSGTALTRRKKTARQEGSLTR